MENYAELPWDIETTCENLRTVKEIMRKKVLLKNLHGKGKSDAEEVTFDYDRAINALEKQIQLKAWIDYISTLDIEYNSTELASILKDFLIN